MKTIFFILDIAFLGCHPNYKSTSQNSEIAPSSSAVTDTAISLQTAGSLEGSWRLIPVMASDTATGKIPTLSFSINNKQVNGHTGCNSFSGTFVTNGDSLRFNNDLVSTKMTCTGYDEAAFVKNLGRTTRYKVNGDTLTLKADQIPLSYWLNSK